MQTILLISLLFICSFSAPLQIQQHIDRDQFIISNSKTFSLNQFNHLKPETLNSLTQPNIGESIQNHLIRKNQIEDLDKFNNITKQVSLQICLTNYSKSLLLNQGYSDCSYTMQMINSEKHPPIGNLQFIKHWNHNIQQLAKQSHILVDYSKKAIRLPQPTLNRLIQNLKQSDAYCDLMQGYLHCTNFTSRDYHHDQLQISIQQTTFKLVLRNLVKECQQLKQCSFWISKSQSQTVKLGSILLRKYSTKFQNQIIKFSSQYYQPNQILVQINIRKYQCLLALLFVSIALSYIYRSKKVSSYSKISNC